MRGSVRARRHTAFQNAASAVRGSDGEPVDMATLHGGAPAPLGSASPLRPASPGAATVPPASMVLGGTPLAQEMRQRGWGGAGRGEANCSQMKQNTTHSREIITPASRRDAGLSIAFWIRDLSASAGSPAAPTILKEATRGRMGRCWKENSHRSGSLCQCGRATA